MSRIYQSRQSATNQAPLIPLTRHLHHSPDLTIFISDSSIFQSSDFTPTVQPDPASHHHSSVPDPPHPLSHSVQLFLLDLPCTFYRSDTLFILSESILPEQQRLHDNLSHNPICCHLLFPVIFGAILFNSSDRILHHSGRIN